MSVTYYDSYAGVPAELAAPNDPAIHKDIHGKPAFSKTAVLTTTNTPTVWEWGVSYADWRGRVLYALSRDRHQRTDKVHNTYSPTGLLVQTASQHAPYQQAVTPLLMTQRHEYDHAGRLLRLYMTVTGRGGQYDGREQLLAAYRYNELGQLSSKSQHGKATGGFIQTQRFSYNVRGWLTKLNDMATVQSGTGAKGDLFAFTLHYNTLPVNSIVAGGTAQYNGNIAAQSWVSRRDGVERGFTYHYDEMNRLVSANYVASNVMENNNYSTAHTYDLNGNIKTTYRRGVIQMTTPTNGVPSFTYGEMDNMQYNYANSNRLRGVVDNATLANSDRSLPDFDDDINHSNQDYTYDHNGNLRADNNKGIVAIEYNYLNLPTFIDFGTRGSISYEYNAAGAKLRKTVAETGKPSKTTDYIGGLVYENDTLKFMPTAEGRMVFQTPPSGAGGLYQYHYKDHLGNVRMTFAPDVPIKETLRLTAEADSAGKESQDFSNLVLNRTAEDAVEGWYSVALAKSKGSISSRVLKVAKGDQLSLSTRATYDQEKIATLAVGNAPANRWGSVALAAGGLLAVQDVSIGGETKSKSLNFNFLAAVPFVKTLFSPKIKTLKTPPSGVGGLTPKGYVEIAVYKDSLCTELVSVKQLPITDKGAYFWEFLQDSVSFDTDGFAVVSLRNESDKSVLFDDLRVDLFGTAEAIIVQENHYEPFGMTLRGLDYVLNPAQKNNFLYQSKEKEEDLGLEMYDFHARNYDPQIGRTNQIDPHADTYQGLSPYSWVANNPIRLKDPTGKDWGIEEKKGGGYKISIRMALLNSSDNKKLNMLALAFQISEQITNTYSQDGKNDVSINIRFIDNVDEAKDYEHLTQVVSSKVLGEDVVAKAPFVGDDKGGLRIYLNEKFVGDVISGKDKRTVGHEMGHTGFLLHPEDPDSGSQQLPIKSNERNTMFQRGTLENYYQQNGLTLDVGKANKITDAQMMLLYSNYKGGKLNHSNGSGKYAGISTGQLITNYEDYYGKKITRFLQEIFW